MSGSSSSDPLLRARSRRAARARADLLRARGLAPQAALDPPSPSSSRFTLRRPTLLPRAVAHSALLGLVALILAGELLGAWSTSLAARPGLAPAPADAAHGPPDLAAGVGAYGPPDLAAGVVLPLALAPLRLVRADPVPAAPALQRLVEVPSAFQAYHQLVEGETLGLVAERYGVGLDALVWANGLERGDALVQGQVLRIPQVAGLPHVVAEGETVAAIAARFGVQPEAIVAFGPNQIGPDLRLQPGFELFIPGGVDALPGDWLSSVGGAAGLAQRGPERAGVVLEAKTNLRTGPSTEHPRVLQLDAGRRVALRARHAGWLQVQLGAARGWIRADMLDVPADWVLALPETSDFPAPPPRWVWPARGAISSRFGPRWGGFHNGLDIANRAWTIIVAARAGTVKEAGWCSGYGYCVKLIHGGGVETVYGHLIDRPVVARGDEVAAGELIGYMGSTYDRAGGGYSTGVHLHFTVYVNGRAVDPLRFLP